MSTLTLINGQPASTISIADRGFAYGQGVFETIQVRCGRRLLWDAHLARLLDGCGRLAIPTDGVAEQLERDWSSLAVARDGVLKLTVTRGAGGRGYAVTEAMAPSRILRFTPAPVSTLQQGEPDSVRLRWCSTRLARQPLLAGIKHLNRLEQVLARAEWQDPAIREGLVCDTDGWVVEGTMSNLFFVRDGRLCTPDLSYCGVSGIIRNWILQAASAADVVCEVGHYRPPQVEQAAEIFICNSLIDILPVGRLGARSYPVGAVTRLMQQLLQQEYQLC